MLRRTRGLFLALVGAGGGLACGGPSIPEWGDRSPQVSAALRQSGRVIRVPEDQPTIAAAMAVALPGDTVKLAPGEFHETLVLKTGVGVVGSPSTLDATGLDNGIVVPADVTCCASAESLTVKASNEQCILVQGAHGVRLSKVTLDGCGVAGAAGIRMDDAQVTLEDSTIRGSGGAGIRAVSSDFTMTGSVLTANTGAGLRSEGSTVRLRDNVLSENFRGVVLVHGSTATLERNQLSSNQDTGLYVYAGDDIQDQVRCTVKSSNNVASANEQGLQIFNSDLTSENDRFDGNGDGVIAGYGATVSAERVSASDNRRIGILTRDVVEYLFCADPDCTMTVFASAGTRFKGEALDIERNAQDGFQVLTGGDVDIRRSTISGNGIGGYGPGISVISGNDYQLGDGIVHHVDIPGRLMVSVTNLDQNHADGLIAVGGGSVALRGVNARQNRFNGVDLTHGATGDVADSHLEKNGGAGIMVNAGTDATDQVRSTAHLRGNSLTGNDTGMWLFNSDVSSDSDRFDRNEHGVLVGFGGNLVARKGSVSFNRGVGLWARDVTFGFLCASADCSRRVTASARAVVALADMDLNGNAFPACFVGPGGAMDVRHSRMRGNGTGGFGNGLVVDSIEDYVDPDDGTLQHVDVRGQATVRDSLIEGNNGWGAVLFGSSSLDLGGVDRGRNSLVGNNNGAVLNGSSPTRNLSAFGNWWGSTTEDEIAAQMTGPVDFVPFLTEPPEGSVRYSAAADFSSNANPNQSWSYGWAASPGAPLNLYLLHGQTYSTTEVGWFGPVYGAPWAPGYPLVLAAPVAHPPTLDMGPGPSLYTVVRWTAPRSGRYDVFGKFFGTGLGTTDAHVLQGATPLFDAAVNGNDLAPYYLTVTLAKGESIDFEVGPGPGGNHDSDSTGFTALVAPRD